MCGEVVNRRTLYRDSKRTREDVCLCLCQGKSESGQTTEESERERKSDEDTEIMG